MDHKENLVLEFLFVHLNNLKNINIYSQLQELSIIGCTLDSVTGIEAIGTSLERLFIVDCKLTSIEKAFTSLTSLKFLNLGSNDIKEIKNLSK